MIKNIVFDLGNVLIRFEPKKYLKNFCDREVLEKVYKTIFESEEWSLLDRGTLTEEEAIERFCSASPENAEIIRKVMKDWYDMLVPIDETVDILKKLKLKGYKLFVLSNYHKKAFEYTINKNDFFKLFDGMVVSYSLNLIKPEKQIYEYLLKKYNINPCETLFIDDVDKNVEAAKMLGISTIKFQNIDQLINDLEKYGITM